MQHRFFHDSTAGPNPQQQSDIGIALSMQSGILAEAANSKFITAVTLIGKRDGKT